MAGLAEMLQSGASGPPPSDGASDQGGDAPGKMSVKDAIAVMQRFRITPDDLPLVAGAVDTLMAAQDQGAGAPEGDEGSAPPGPPGGPPQA